jgi:hypothetical protein
MGDMAVHGPSFKAGLVEQPLVRALALVSAVLESGEVITVGKEGIPKGEGDLVYEVVSCHVHGHVGASRSNNFCHG